jgi:hypothetical protein
LGDAGSGRLPELSQQEDELMSKLKTISTEGPGLSALLVEAFVEKGRGIEWIQCPAWRSVNAAFHNQQ